MGLARNLLQRTFGRPRGLLGRLGGHLMARMNAPCAASVLALLAIEPTDRVLEIGFGPGVGIALAARKAATVAGADLSPEMLAQASARNRAAVANGRVDLRLASAERLPFATESFDKAIAMNSMQLWPDKLAGLREIFRVLKPGGRVALGFTPKSGQGKEGLIEALSTAGFIQAHIVDATGCICALGAKP